MGKRRADSAAASSESHRARVITTQLTIVLVFLALWEWLPEIHWISDRWALLNPSFISSPSQVVGELGRLFRGQGGVLIWPYLKSTLIATLIGVCAGLAIGVVVGVLMSTYEFLRDTLRPFVIAVNSLPRIAFIPIVILIVGPGESAAVISSILVVFFIGFFNSFVGGTRIPAAVIENFGLMGASKFQELIYVRSAYALVWTFAAVPNAIAFGLITVVTTELLTGGAGIGSLIIQGTQNLDASLIFGVVVVLGVVGMLLTLGAEYLQSRIARWSM
jgi:NitT/TauT family transport system permease protein